MIESICELHVFPDVRWENGGAVFSFSYMCVEAVILVLILNINLYLARTIVKYISELDKHKLKYIEKKCMKLLLINNK